MRIILFNDVIRCEGSCLVKRFVVAAVAAATTSSLLYIVGVPVDISHVCTTH